MTPRYRQNDPERAAAWAIAFIVIALIICWAVQCVGCTVELIHVDVQRRPASPATQPADDNALSADWIEEKALDALEASYE